MRVLPPPNPAPAEVRAVCEAFCQLVDEAAPGLLEGLYLHGSLGFGEWYVGTSDVDFVAVLSRRADREVADVLDRVHGDLQLHFPTPSFDGMHLTWDDLAQAPDACPDVPCTLGGHWETEGRMDVNPVTWHELGLNGMVMRGPGLAEVPLWSDQRALRQYTHDNLAAYWSETADSLVQFPSEAGKPEMVTWMVLGTSRLHHLLATDELTSKSGAGIYALDAFGERWRRLVAEALCWREQRMVSGTYQGREDERAADVIEFSQMVVERGLAIPV